MPRVRKAPTVREQIEVAGKKAEARPKLRRPSLGIGKFFRPVGKVLSWVVPRYFINSWRELRQVTWPSRRETWRLTGAVLIFALVFGALVALVDKGLDELFKKVILK